MPKKTRKARPERQFSAIGRVNLKGSGLPEALRYAFLTAIGLIKKYRLPCDMQVRKLRPRVLAQHGWRTNGTCAVAL